jgi:hypothetical protein
MSENTTTNQTPASEATPTDNQPDFNNMTGEEAKAWVAAQKAQESTPKAGAIKEAAQSAAKQSIDKPTQDQKEAAREAIRKFKVKVNGQEQEVDENELLRGYSHQQAANKILQEGKAARKQAEEFIAMMKDPSKFYEVAAKLGHNPRELSEKYLVSQLEDEMLDPRDRELRDAKTKLKHIEDMERQQREAVEQQRLNEMKAKYAEDYTQQFTKALETSGLPPTKAMVGEMAKYIARSAKIGFKMTPDEAAQLVREDIQQAHKRLIGDSDGDTLIKLLGEDVANKIRKYDTSKLKDPNQYLQTPKNQEKSESKVRTNSNKRMTPLEWKKFNRGR